ncbi:hypothetical protein UYSO10_4581 [Kosakonia radicincitans]|nr:hypothetical protein UYSO10_4581 [Kosakonia radicincitans]
MLNLTTGFVTMEAGNPAEMFYILNKIADCVKNVVMNF